MKKTLDGVSVSEPKSLLASQKAWTVHKVYRLFVRLFVIPSMMFGITILLFTIAIFANDFSTRTVTAKDKSTKIGVNAGFIEHAAKLQREISSTQNSKIAEPAGTATQTSAKPFAITGKYEDKQEYIVHSTWKNVMKIIEVVKKLATKNIIFCKTSII